MIAAAPKEAHGHEVGGERRQHQEQLERGRHQGARSPEAQLAPCLEVVS